MLAAKTCALRWLPSPGMEARQIAQIHNLLLSGFSLSDWILDKHNPDLSPRRLVAFTYECHVTWKLWIESEFLTWCAISPKNMLKRAFAWYSDFEFWVLAVFFSLIPLPNVSITDFFRVLIAVSLCARNTKTDRQSETPATSRDG